MSNLRNFAVCVDEFGVRLRQCLGRRVVAPGLRVFKLVDSGGMM
jgi:hypothetical protein